MAFLLFHIPSSICAELPAISLSEAILKALEANPGVKVQEEKIKQSEGLLQTASGQFDWVTYAALSIEEKKLPLNEQDLEAAEAASLLYNTPLIDFQEEDTAIYTLGLLKQLRNGIIISPSIAARDYDVNTDDRDNENRSDLNIEIIIPLLRGLGSKNTGAEEMAAESNLKATELVSRHNIAGIIFSTSVHFWNCLAAQLGFELTADTQNRAEKLLKLVEMLVKVGTLEPAFLNQAKAKLFSNQVDLSEGEMNLYKSKQTLAIDMGYTPEELAIAPNPSGTFPRVIDISKLETEDAEKYINEALKRRGDYLASQINIEKGTILLHKARNDAKPRLDFGIRVGYAGIDESPDEERYYQSFSNNLTGLNTYALLTLELPVFNTAARGNIVYRRSLLREAELTLSNLSNHIASEVLVALKALRSSINEYQLAAKSESAYKKAVEFENQKYKTGTSTLSDLIDIEDRYFNARISKIDALRKYAVALAEFRFVTGTLLDVQDRTLRFRADNLSEFPLFNQTK